MMDIQEMREQLGQRRRKYRFIGSAAAISVRA